jgi:beta-1,4-mannosyl-glycoprotein beta-1,4-N-acetylglucosaminyltransferase
MHASDRQTRERQACFVLIQVHTQGLFYFHYMSDFAFKMQAYSHVDRIRFKYSL